MVRETVTPQSQGLPSIEEYNNEYPESFVFSTEDEIELAAQEISFRVPGRRSVNPLPVLNMNRLRRISSVKGKENFGP